LASFALPSCRLDTRLQDLGWNGYPRRKSSSLEDIVKKKEVWGKKEDREWLEISGFKQPRLLFFYFTHFLSLDEKFSNPKCFFWSTGEYVGQKLMTTGDEAISDWKHNGLWLYLLGDDFLLIILFYLVNNYNFYFYLTYINYNLFIFFFIFSLIMKRSQFPLIMAKQIDWIRISNS